ncbi:MAG TPA: bifunctional 3,4-dihydroxy-2-butanone-4-phosphate synthase/GTP cyclohydrolase II [Candidatus Dormibacteraeota bacterium]|nr:bifunctional 3,4-dihydroxy-2-butanone-4-phosphate synthase/GTP cyclohydrolase II [Candidatus Dormibacteraeota bacterium]
MALATISEAVADLEDGKPIIIVDDEDRENEGDLCVAAQLITPQHITFMSRHGGGLVCTAMMTSRLDELQIEPMVNHNTSRYGTAFSVSVEAKDLVTTGISAYDRAATIRHLINPDAKPHDFAKPGHTFPLRAAEGGVLKRAGQTEAAVDLTRLAGLYPAGVICEVMNDDGTMARMPDLEHFAAEYGIKIVTIKDLIVYRRRNEKLVQQRSVAEIPIEGRIWKIYVYEDTTSHEEHVAVVLGEIDPDRPVLVRAHSECLTGDVFGSMRCDCGAQLQAARRLIAEEGSGVIMYIRYHEGRGIGLADKLHAYRLQDEEGMDTVEANEALGHPADKRDYGVGAQILYDLGVRGMRLLTNNPKKIYGLGGYGLEIVEQVPIKIAPNPYNERYLRTKKEKLGHNL